MPHPENPPSNGFIRLLLESAASFPTRIELMLEAGPYRIQTATSFADLRQALALRHTVFFEKGLGRCLPEGLDLDAFDPDSDHLLVVDRRSERVVGNYRLRCSLFHRTFYSQREFVLDELLAEPTSVKLEMGRACVHPEYRGSLVIQMLWRGLREYVRRTAARFLFGCSSMPADAPGRVESVWDELVRLGRVSSRFAVLPRLPFA